MNSLNEKVSNINNNSINDNNNNNEDDNNEDDNSKVLFNFPNPNITHEARQQNTFYKPPATKFNNSQDVRNKPKLNQRIKKTLAIGDSFIGIFKLLKPEANVRIEKIKGGTAKGLFRIGSESNTKLQSIFENKNHYDCGLFNFGQVDHHISFYWDLIEKQQENDTEYYKTLANNYVNFIASLPGFDRKIIFGVYPLPCTTPFISQYLRCYTRIEPEKIDSYIANNNEKWEELISLDVRAKRITDFNIALEQECLNHEIEFASVYDKLVDENHNVKSTFKDPSDCNIHLLWEPLILEWCKYFSNEDVGILEEYLEDIEQSGQAYLTEKTREVNKWKGIKDEQPDLPQNQSTNKYTETYVGKDRRVANNRGYIRNNRSNTDNVEENNNDRVPYNFNNRGSNGNRGGRYYDNRSNGNNGHRNYDEKDDNRSINTSTTSNATNKEKYSNTVAPITTITPTTVTSNPSNLYVPPHLRKK